MSVRERLGALARARDGRRALALALAVLALVGAAFALAAGAAGLGLLLAARWAPLLLWALVAAALAWGAVLVRRTLGRGEPALREMATVVERERELRRGSLAGLLDPAGAGTSSALLARAERRVAARLPEDAESWAPAGFAAAGGLVRRRSVAAVAATLAAAFAFWRAGDAAAAFATPVAAWRAALRPALRLTVSREAVGPGEPVEVDAQAPAGTPRIALYMRATGESWRPVIVPADQAGRATHRLASLRGTTWVYAAAGGAVSETLSVRLVRPLVAGELSVGAKFPAYLDRPDEELDPTVPVVVPVGTVLTVRGAASAALARAALAAPRDTLALRVRGGSFEGQLSVHASAEWRLLLAGREGAPGADTLRIDVVAVPDSAPAVAVTVPGADTAAPLDLRPVLVVDARDDHGLGRVEVLSWRKSRLGLVGDTVVDSLAGAAGADHVILPTVLDIATRGLLPGDTLRYVVRAVDRAPRPNVGWSGEYAFRLRTMSELREAARRQADSLAQGAAQLARDQGTLSQQTEDLAAQRNRAADRTARPDAGQQGDRNAQTGTEPFEQQAQAQRSLEEQQALVQRAESLRTAVQELADAAQQAGLNDPAWQQQLHELDQLLRQALTPDLLRSMEELQRALEQLDPRAVQEALRNMADQQRALREELERSAELFERAAIEGSMQTYSQQAQALERAEREWSDQARARADSTAAVAEQERLRHEADSLAHQLDSLGRRLERRGDSTTRRSVDSSGAQVAAAAQSMQQASSSMQEGDRRQAEDASRRAADQLQQVPQNLDAARAQQSAAWRNEVLRFLGRSMQETVELAREEQRLATEARENASGNQEMRGRQAAVEQGIGQVLRQLQESSGRNALVSPRLGASLSRARDLARQSREAMEGATPSPDEAGARAQDAAQMLSAAAMQMMRASEDVASAQSGSGFAEAVQRLAQLAGQQGQINDQLGGLLPMLGSGQAEVMRQLQQLAAQQRRLAADLERLGANGMPGHPERLAEEARQLADRIESARLDRATLERQQRLFRRMLDAGRTLQSDEDPDDPERKSRTAGATGPASMTTTMRAQAQRYPAPSWDELRALPPAERAMVLDYFRRLNAQQR